MTDLYQVNDVYPTIQGEGCLAGTPMALVRLHGCPVGCPFCDTKETWHVEPVNKVEDLKLALGTNPLWSETTAQDVAIMARYLSGPGIRWALVTGGEPADQVLTELVFALHDKGFKAALETSGTALGHLAAPFDWVCVSPKYGMPGGRAVLTETLAHADEIKFVVGKESDLINPRHISQMKLLKPGATICLQPMSLSEKATQLCIEACQQHGWRLSIQTHQLLKLR